MTEEVSALARWAQVYRDDARERAGTTKDKHRFVAFSTEQTAIDLQLIADELQLSKTLIVSRLVSIGAREVCKALNLVESGAIPEELDEQQLEDSLRWGDEQLRKRRSDVASALRSRNPDVEEVGE